MCSVISGEACNDLKQQEYPVQGWGGSIGIV